MPLVAPKPSSNHPLPPDGTHIARCYSMIDIGTHETTGQFGTKRQRKIRLSFELPEELHVFSEEKGEQPFTIHQQFTFAMSEKANLRKFLANWRGKAFSDKEAYEFDVAKLLGVPALITISYTDRGERTYANITSAAKLMKGQVCPPQVNERIEFSLGDYDDEVFNNFPEWLQQEIASSDEYKAMSQRSKSSGESTSGGSPGNGAIDEDDDIPF